MTETYQVDVLADVDVLAAAFSDGRAGTLFAALDGFVHARLNQALCTVNRYDAETEQVVRLYSSDPVAYPVGGSKNKAGTAWGKHVLHEQQVFVGQGIQAIRSFFDDHQAIQSLGLQSVINVPVVFAGRCLGTLNFLMSTPEVSSPMVQVARWAGLMAVPGFMVASGGAN